MRSWYAVAHPGLEAIVAAELAEHGIKGTAVPGGVRFPGDAATGVRLAPLLRTPDRLLAELVEGVVRSSDELGALVRKADWMPLLDPQSRFEVHASVQGSRLHFKDSVEKKVSWAISEALRGPRVPGASARPRLVQRIQVRLDNDRATISIDAGGDLLHRRGWRTDVSRAPIRENLAACLLRVAGWDGREPLLDPFCGSGTLAIEAALMASGRSPYVGRTLACSEWPIAKKAHKGGRPGQAVGPRRDVGSGGPILVASDRDPAALRAAIANAERAKVQVQWRVLDVGDIEPPAATGLCVANPPWGERLGAHGGYGPEAGAVLAKFGRMARERLQGWRIVFLAPTRELAEKVQRDVRPILTFPNGGLRVTAWTFTPP